MLQGQHLRLQSHLPMSVAAIIDQCRATVQTFRWEARLQVGVAQALAALKDAPLLHTVHLTLRGNQVCSMAGSCQYSSPPPEPLGLSLGLRATRTHTTHP